MLRYNVCCKGTHHDQHRVNLCFKREQRTYQSRKDASIADTQDHPCDNESGIALNETDTHAAHPTHGDDEREPAVGTDFLQDQVGSCGTGC